MWLVVATAVGLVIGLTIRLRDRQVFEEEAGEPVEPLPRIPTQKSGSHERRRGT